MPDPALQAPKATRRFVRRLLRAYADAELTSMIHLGHVSGLWSALAAGPGTSEEVARRAGGLDERYVREWLSAVASARIVQFDPHTRRFRLDRARATCLTGDSVYNVAPGSRMVSMGAAHLDRVARAFRTGEAIPYSAYLPEFPEVMDDLGRRRYEALLVSHYVPLARGLARRLAEGIRVADVGTGSGRTLMLLAAAYPRSTFVGIDPASAPIARARAEARRKKLRNVRWVRGDAGRMRSEGPFDLVTMFDVIHDLEDPAGVLREVVRSLAPGGEFLAVEPRASSDLTENIGRSGATFLYGISVTYCLPVSRGNGGAGLGTCWGTARATALLREVGLSSVRTFEAPGNALASIFVARKAPGRHRGAP